MKHINKVFKGCTVTLDGNEYVGCTFENCTLKYSGGEVNFSGGGRILNSKWNLTDSAERTLCMMRFIRSLNPDMYESLMGIETPTELNS